MKYWLAAISGSMVSFLLTACGPIYKTEHAYVPPKSKMGNMCISNCIQQKTMCEQMCQMRNENCRARAHQDALYQFKVYKDEQRSRNQPIQKDVRDFESTFGCNTSCDCSQTFNTCYEACGGEVLERKVCVAFCDKQ